MKLLKLLSKIFVNIFATRNKSENIKVSVKLRKNEKLFALCPENGIYEVNTEIDVRRSKKGKGNYFKAEINKKHPIKKALNFTNAERKLKEFRHEH